MTTTHHFETLQLHAGQQIGSTRARAVPIYQTTSYVFENSQHGADLFGLKAEGYIYSRIANPTVDVFEQRIAALEGGVGAVAAASGQAAQVSLNGQATLKSFSVLAIAAIAETGDNIVTTAYLYGGSYNQFKVFFKRFGIEFRFVDGDNPEDYIKAIAIEPGLFKRLATQITTCLTSGRSLIWRTNTSWGDTARPIDHGADIVVHLATKWIGGHGTTIAGAVVDAGNFDWAASGRFRSFTEPSEGYHGLKFSETFGKNAFIFKVRLNVLRDAGPALSANSAFLLLQGLETLSLRVERHNQNALTLAKWLQAQPSVSWVDYIGLPHHPYHTVAKKQFRKDQSGSILSFGIKGDSALGAKVVDSLKLASNLANVGDVKTLTDEDKVRTGTLPDAIRVSVGIEHIDDIIADFRQALKSITA